MRGLNEDRSYKDKSHGSDQIGCVMLSAERFCAGTSTDGWSAAKAKQMTFLNRKIIPFRIEDEVSAVRTV